MEGFYLVKQPSGLQTTLNKITMLGKLLFTPVVMLAIRFESVLANLGVPLWGMMRTPCEIRCQPRRFFNLLQASGAIPGDARFISLLPLGDLKTEPEKSRTCCSVRLTYQHAGLTMKGHLNSDEGICTKELFVKFQTGRHLPLWLQAVRAIVEFGVSREIDAYNNVLGKVEGLHTAKALLARKVSMFNRVFLVLERERLQADEETEYENLNSPIYQVINDSQGASIKQIESILGSLARLHAKFMSCANRNRLSNWLPKRRGVEFMLFIKDFISKDPNVCPPHFISLFGALLKHFAIRPVTVIHGDARPGNVLFPVVENQAPIMVDWEAINIAPGAYDVTYCLVLGLTPELRREYTPHLIHLYCEALWTAMGMNVERMGRAELRKRYNEIEDQVHLLTLVLYYLGSMLGSSGVWRDQGNTTTDNNHWKVRIGSAVCDLDAKHISSLLMVPISFLQDTQQRVSGHLDGATEQLQQE